MIKLFILLAIGCVLIAGCEPAGITAVRWDSGLKSPNVQVRCERVDMRDQSEMNAAFAKYDGWKLIYISEYTTGHKVGTDAAVCFESPK